MRNFFVISYMFIDWMFSKHKYKYVFNMYDDKYPDYDFRVTVERIKK